MNASGFRRGRRAIAGVLLLSLAFAACAPVSTPAQPTDAPAEPSALVTSNGFVCPEPSPRAEVTSKQINLFLWTEYVPADIIECFSLVYDIQVNQEYFSSNEELDAKLRAGAAGYDIVHPSDYIINVMIRGGLLQELDKSRLSNLANLNPGYLELYGDQADYVSPYQLGTQAIVYNSAVVENPPTSWADLWSPEYENRLVMIDDTRVIIGMALLTLGYDINTSDAAQLAEAEDRLKELASTNVKMWDSDSPKTALIAGDADLGVVWNGEAFLALQELDTIEYVLPSEGAILFQDGFAIPTDAPHIDAAYAWMNYLLQGDVAWLLLQDYPYTVPNQAALDFAQANHPDVYAAYAESNITNASPEDLQNTHRVEDVGDALQLYDRVWTEIKGGS